MKKFLCGLFLGLLLAFSGVALAGENVRLVINGTEIKPDVPPTIINGRVLVPIRALGESLGATVQWDNDKRTVVVVSSQTKNQFTKEQIIEFVKPATVKIVSDHGTENMQGSGFNLEPTGLIVTNSHVVENAGNIEVIFPDRTKFRAYIKSIDPKKDIAVLKLYSKVTNLPTVALGDSNGVKQGQDIIAIGSPLGVVGTVANGTVGNVSVAAQGFPEPLMEINLNINNGFSGGPVLNYSGKVIGIVTGQILEGKNPINNLSVAIPINEVKPMLDQISNP